jgi:hypothetical protein
MRRWLLVLATGSLALWGYDRILPEDAVVEAPMEVQPPIPGAIPDAGSPIAGIAGRVRGPAGPVAGARLELRAGSFRLTATADQDGSFAFEDLAPGSYELLAIGEGLQALETVSLKDRQAPIELDVVLH